MKKEQRLFRKKAFGGFNKEDVIAYIEKMKLEFSEYKQQVEETMETLHAQIDALEGTPKADEPVVEKADDDAVESIAEATARLKEVGESLCENLNALIDRMQTAPNTDVPAAQPKKQAAPKGEYSKDAALVESVLPAYLR